MPGINIHSNNTSRKKRKVEDAFNDNKEKKANSNKSQQQKILELENQIQESQRNYNHINALLSLAKKDREVISKINLDSCTALCRVFCRLHADGKLSGLSSKPENEALITRWLKERHEEFSRLLLDMLCEKKDEVRTLSLGLCMQLVNSEITAARSNLETSRNQSLFGRILSTLIKSYDSVDTCRQFTLDYVNHFDDIRHQTFVNLNRILLDHNARDSEIVVTNCTALLEAINVAIRDKTELADLYCASTKDKHSITFSAHLKQAQQAWVSLLKCELNKSQRKRLLEFMTSKIVPWFSSVELLMDFLTDSYEVGGSTSLLALSGLFYLMQERNLDYPNFFPKLYSLLDYNILHSKHRSRFFRLLNTFMASTHLPAAMVASFIKRLSRLCLYAPPAGIVAVVPWVYNLLKTHPTCTFMIHREPRTEEEREKIEEEGFHDPFDMAEPNPMATRAIDSSLWELETLQSHYHPNVASLASIISEQFTKRSYNLDDFLDHSYNSLLDSELNRQMKKTPVVEYQIPKTIFTTSDGDETLKSLMTEVLKYY